MTSRGYEIDKKLQRQSAGCVKVNLIAVPLSRVVGRIVDLVVAVDHEVDLEIAASVRRKVIQEIEIDQKMKKMKKTKIALQLIKLKVKIKKLKNLNN